MVRFSNPSEIDFTVLEANPAESLGQEYRTVTIEREDDGMTIDIPAMVEWRFPATGFVLDPGALCIPSDITMGITEKVLDRAETLESDAWPGGTCSPTNSEPLTLTYLAQFSELSLDGSGHYIRRGDAALFGTAEDPALRKTRVTLSVKASTVTVTFQKHGHYTVTFRRITDESADGRWSYVAKRPEVVFGVHQRAYCQRRYLRDQATGSLTLTLQPAEDPFHPSPHSRRVSKRVMDAVVLEHQRCLDTQPKEELSKLRYDFVRNFSVRIDSELLKSHQRVTRTTCSTLPDALQPDLRHSVQVPHAFLNRPFEEGDIKASADHSLKSALELLQAAGSTREERLHNEVITELANSMADKLWTEFCRLEMDGTFKQKAQLVSRMMMPTTIAAVRAARLMVNAMDHEAVHRDSEMPIWSTDLLLEPNPSRSGQAQSPANNRASAAAGLKLAWDVLPTSVVWPGI
jgi:hypothetical protein